ncbi:NAD(P)-dependent oxidoreductase [Flammeovirga kamogawensis]|uniref:Phosphoglycerate dehydrogenase n=1 Tax=Flammeovirga kamogawensis TaxID=373891 RepID=A0ABX8GUJ7_9BACT|nr:NAD(P)-dependent oxidoreductase [Flammeovirga kamogawensis]MBB6463978.1 D-3-phosphoglycerate dehydrogenase [Flammeovirga kamogawensis]QWG06605.1 phosphoglycerate dehydrogenase [Flammeovirga kamogawensis]TRX68429.1 phosphoglycerate dehydrogenase [Flammeovirga kamogawensis]
MTKVLIIDKLHDAILPILEQENIEVTYNPGIAVEEVPNVIKDYNGLILRSKMKIGVELLELAPKLRFIARAGAGVDEIDEEYLQRRNITLLNAPEGNMDAVGEHTIAMLLCLMNFLHIGNTEVRQKLWLREENRGHELSTRTVGIIGYGNMGKAFAKRLIGFGCKVLAYDNGKSNYGDEYAQEASLEQIQKEADVLSFHIPLNKENKHLFTKDYLGAFNKPIYLLNLARGEVIPFSTIEWGLDNGKIIAAGLDVLENEKLHTLSEDQERIFNKLCDDNRVIFTPHVGGWSFESYEKISTVLGGKIIDLLKK